MSSETELSRLLTRALRAEQAKSRVPSISAAVVRGGAVIWADAVGHVDGRADGAAATPDTQYRIGSITKTFAAVLMLRLVDDGVLALDDRLEQHLPEVKIGAVTLESLLSQRSGLRAETEPPWWERTAGRTWLDLEAQLALRPAARGVFHYSNVGFGVLAEVVARHRGRPWHQVLAEEVLQPLGMQRTTTRPQAPHAVGLAVHPYADLLHDEPEHHAGAMAAAGQLWSTTADLGRWAHFLHTGAGDLLSAESLAAMKRPRSWSDLPGQPWTVAYGLGLEVFNSDGRRSFGHGGSMPGFQAGLRFDSETGDSVITMYNTTSGISGRLPGELARLLAEHAPAGPPIWTADAGQAGLVELTGAWFWGPAAFDLHLRPRGWLELTPRGRGRGSRFAPTGTDTWVGLDGYYLGEELRAVRVGDRLSHWDLASFRLTRTPYDPDGDIPGGAAGGWG